MPRTYVVIENTPGYLADDTDPPTFTNLRDARSYATELAKELRADGYRIYGNQKDGYCCERDADDLGRVIEAVEVEGDR